MTGNRREVASGEIEVTLRGLGLDEALVRTVHERCRRHSLDPTQRWNWRVSLVRPPRSDEVRASVVAVDTQGRAVHAFRRGPDVGRAVAEVFADLRMPGARRRACAPLS